MEVVMVKTTYVMHHKKSRLQLHFLKSNNLYLIDIKKVQTLVWQRLEKWYEEIR